MLLESKNAVIYGGGGSIGGAVARAFAREGARVFLAGRTPAKLDAVADEIRSAGGAAETAVVDALDEHAVDEHADAVAAEAGGIDISFNSDHPPAHPHDPARRDGGRRLHGAGGDRCANHVPDRQGGRAAHDPAAFGRDPRVWRPRRPKRPDARLLPGRNPGRVRRDRDDAAAARGRARTARNPRRHARERRRARDTARRIRGSRADRRDDRTGRHCSAGPRRSRTWATRPCSPRPTGPAA